MDDVEEYDPLGRNAWLRAREHFGAMGRTLSPLVDMHPSDRRHRLRGMFRSNVPEERAAAAAELSAMLDHDPCLQDALFEACARTPPQPDPAPLPDAPWAPVGADGMLLVLRARRDGHVMVVRESGTAAGTYYAVVDGHHLSWRGEPPTFANVLDAIIAAEAAVDAEIRATFLPTELCDERV